MRLWVGVIFAILGFWISLLYIQQLGWNDLSEERNADWYLGYAYTLAHEGRYQDCIPKTDSYACATPLPQRAYRLPGYSTFLAGALLIFPDAPAGVFRILNSLMFAMITFWSVALTCRLTQKTWAGVVTGVMIIFSPTMAYFSSVLFTETLFCFLVMWFLIAFAKGRREAGLLFGLALLTRGTLLFAIPLVIYLAPQRRFFTLSMIAPVLLWMLRNWLVLGALVPFSTGTGQVLYGVYNEVSFENATGEWLNPPTVPGWSEFADLDEVEQDKALTRAAIDFARHQSVPALVESEIAKLGNLAGIGPIRQDEWSDVVTFSLINCLWIVLIWTRPEVRQRAKRIWRHTEMRLMAVLLLATLINTLVFYGSPRFRSPFIPLLVIMSAVGAVEVVYALRNKPAKATV